MKEIAHNYVYFLIHQFFTVTFAKAKESNYVVMVFYNYDGSWVGNKSQNGNIKPSSSSVTRYYKHRLHKVFGRASEASSVRLHLTVGKSETNRGHRKSEVMAMWKPRSISTIENIFILLKRINSVYIENC